MYIPPSQYTTGFYTYGNEYTLSTNGENYIGKYWKLKTGEAFSGLKPSVGPTSGNILLYRSTSQSSNNQPFSGLKELQNQTQQVEKNLMSLNKINYQ